MALEKGKVCVTGAGGYLASWVVKLLLSKDYFVRGTVREPSKCPLFLLLLFLTRSYQYQFLFHFSWLVCICDVSCRSNMIISSGIMLLLAQNFQWCFFIVNFLKNKIAGDEKNTHLYKLEKASENLKLFKADLLDYDSVKSAIVGCNGVFHVASPVPSSSVPNPEASKHAKILFCLHFNDIQWYM